MCHYICIRVIKKKISFSRESASSHFLLLNYQVFSFHEIWLLSSGCSLQVNAIMDGEGKIFLQGRQWQKLLMTHTGFIPYVSQISSTRIHTREFTMSDEVFDLMSFGALVLSLAGKCKYVLLTFHPGATVDQISIISGPKRKPLTFTMWRLRSAAFAIAPC